MAVPIDLTHFERGDSFTGDFHAALTALQDRIAQLQLSQIVHRRRAIILIEGWPGAGKKDAMRRLLAACDPCHVDPHSVVADHREDNDRHWLARFWAGLPAAGRTAIFYHSWYNLAAEARIRGDLDDNGFSRATDEINEFESQQRDHGTLLVKLFFHIDRERQSDRLRQRRADPWRRALVGPGENDSVTHRAEHESAWQQLFEQTDTRWAPWRIIDAADEQAAQLAALSSIADAYTKAMPADPPAEGDTVVYLDKQRRA